MSSTAKFTLTTTTGSSLSRRVPSSVAEWREAQRSRDVCDEKPDLGVDRCGRRRSRATDPNFRRGVPPGNAGKTYPPQILTPDEIHTLIEACPKTIAWERFAALIACGYRSGLRISELLGLMPHDLDRVRHRVVVTRGKGGRSRYAQMDDWGFDMVEAWMERRAALPAGPVFCIASGPTKGERWTPAGVRQGLKRLKERAGISKRVHPHALRHTLACELMRDGFPLSYIQHALGHRNPATTASYLVSIGAVESLDEVAGRPAPLFARPADIPVCSKCGTTVADGQRVCDPCLDVLLTPAAPTNGFKWKALMDPGEDDDLDLAALAGSAS